MKKLFTFYFFAVGLFTTTHAQWSLTGNAGTVDGTHFLGTTDAKPLNFRISNQVAGRIDSFNLFMGFKAGGKANGAVTRNTAIGGQALSSNTTGVFNTAIGNNALTANTIGSNNVATGNSALFVNTQGTGNTASGYASLYANTIGNYNVATGGFSLFSNVGGTGNTGIGYSALYSNKTGHYNIGIGFSALRFGTASNANTAIGTNAMLNNNADSNVAIGTDAMQGGLYMFNSVAVGAGALYSAKGVGPKNPDFSAFGNTAVGFKSSYSTLGGNYNTAVGYRSLYANTFGSSNTAIGYQALSSNTTGYLNIAIGDNALFSNTVGNTNVAVGNRALYSNLIGAENTALGASALFANVIGTNNVAVGNGALASTTNSSSNTGVGSKALFSNTTGTENTAIGNNSLVKNLTGSSNMAAGYNALSVNLDGSSNTAVGNLALSNNTSGGSNTALGISALANNKTGQENTAVGSAAGPTADNFENTTAIGAFASVTASNQIILGDNSMLYIGGNSDWHKTSDGRYKKNVTENVPGLEFIKKLRPVTYTMNIKGLNTDLGIPDSIQQSPAFAKRVEAREKAVETGFIAQEVEKAAKSLNYDFNGVYKPQNDKDHYGVSYATFVVPLVKAVQEQQVLIEEQMKVINDLKTRLSVLEQQGGVQNNTLISSPIKGTTTNNLAIFPNPTKDGFTVQIPTDGFLSVYEIGTGKEMTRGPKSILRRGAVERFNDTQNWAAGTYMVVLKGINGNILNSGKLLLTK